MSEKKSIKLIVDSYCSKADIYGNRYHFSVITSTKTGKSLRFTTPAHGNTTGLLRKCWEWEEIHGSETELPIREWNRLVKGIDLHISIGKDDEALHMIKDLMIRE